MTFATRRHLQVLCVLVLSTIQLCSAETQGGRYTIHARTVHLSCLTNTRSSTQVWLVCYESPAPLPRLHRRFITFVPIVPRLCDRGAQPSTACCLTTAGRPKEITSQRQIPLSTCRNSFYIRLKSLVGKYTKGKSHYIEIKKDWLTVSKKINLFIYTNFCSIFSKVMGCIGRC